ncbi:MAG: transposase [Chloroflexi bacterium]|nr:transposase [Chloroflexota bacterium]
MNWRQLWNAGKHLITRGLQQLETKVKEWTKPAPDRQIAGIATKLVRSKPELMAENAFLRQQVIVLKRQSTGRPSITQHDRRVLVMLASKLRDWKDALHLVKPDTLTKWHRQGFRLFWRRKSQGQLRKPRISPEAIALIKEMAVKNRLWGSPRIRDELLKLGFKVAKRTVQKYMRQARRSLPPERKSQTWATFLANHADEIWACDFVQTYDLFFRTIYAFFMFELGSRRVVHCGVTRAPSDAWVTQQLREATFFGEGPRFLICDNDRKFGAQFERVAEGSGVDVIHTPVEPPKAKGICERFIGSVRRELLDHILILSERHLRRKVKEYVRYFNRARPHQGLNRQIPIPSSPPPSVVTPLSQLRRIPILGGLHHDYQWAA